MYIIIVNYRLKTEMLIANVIITYSYVQQLAFEHKNELQGWRI